MKNVALSGLLLCASAAAGYLGWQNAGLRRQVADLQETRRLLEQEQHALRQPTAAAEKPEDRAATLRTIESQTSQLRGLPFKKPVTYKSIGRDELKKYLQGKIAEQYNSQEMRDYGRSLETLGLLPAGTDLMEAILAMYDEQVAAFYVPEERALYTFKEKNFDGNIDKITLAHELTHALQDQNYDLVKFPLKAKDNDDLALAASSLVEGDATLLMAQFYGEYLDPRNMIGDLLGAVMGQKTAHLSAAPAFLRDSLLFPYQQGTEFATALFAAGGTEKLHEAFLNPPQSTKEILHPEKFLRDRQAPEKIELPSRTKAGWRLIGNNVVGEFGLRSMFGEQVGVFEAQRAAQGWNGDRYHVYERGTNGPCVLVWSTAWETEADATEFVSAYTRLAGKRGVYTQLAPAGRHVTVHQAGTKATWDDWSAP